MREAGQYNLSMRALSGIIAAGSGLRAGSASEGIVPPRGGAADGPARTHEPRIGAFRPAPLPYGGLLPPAPGAIQEMQGRQNELAVARQTGGTLARDPTAPNKDLEIRFTRPNGQGGVARPDVRGPNGELIAVGGPAKAQNVGALKARLDDLRIAAEQTGVKAQAYFTRDTPPEAIAMAQRALGSDNVFLFDRPDYEYGP